MRRSLGHLGGRSSISCSLGRLGACRSLARLSSIGCLGACRSSLARLGVRRSPGHLGVRRSLGHLARLGVRRSLSLGVRRSMGHLGERSSIGCSLGRLGVRRMRRSLSLGARRSMLREDCGLPCHRLPDRRLESRPLQDCSVDSYSICVRWPLVIHLSSYSCVGCSNGRMQLHLCRQLSCLWQRLARLSCLRQRLSCLWRPLARLGWLRQHLS